MLKSKMASKKGMIVTAIVLAAITGGSFLVWVVPIENQTTFVVSDYEGYLDGVKNIHEVLEEEIELDYQGLRNGEISPQEYSVGADATSSQVIAQISEFVTSKPPEEWQASYINYMEAMKKFNEYIKETKVLASMIENDSSEDQMSQAIQRIEELKDESQELVKSSDESRPN